MADSGVKIYFSKLTKKEIKEKLEQEMETRKLQNDIKYRISSIPSKFCAGYEIEKESGKVIRKPIKTNFKIFSGEKNDSVGPGSYEINLPEIWRKTGTCWSKYLCEKEPLAKRPKSGNDLNANKLINHNKLDKDYIKITQKKKKFEKNDKINTNINAPNFFRIFSSQRLKFKGSTTQNIKSLSQEINKEKLPYFIHVNDVPGPGYYYDEKKNINNKSSKNNFGNLKKINHFEENFIKLNLDDKTGLGPGSYFNDILHLFNNQNQKEKKKTLSKQNNKNAPFLCKSKRFNYDKSLTFNDNNENSTQKDSKINSNGFKKSFLSIESSQTSNSTHKLGLSKKEDSQNEKISNDRHTYKKLKNKNNKFKSMTGLFYRKDLRFRENFQEENMKKDIPGPGSYINSFELIKIMTTIYRKSFHYSTK